MEGVKYAERSLNVHHSKQHHQEMLTNFSAEQLKLITSCINFKGRRTHLLMNRRTLSCHTLFRSYCEVQGKKFVDSFWCLFTFRLRKSNCDLQDRYGSMCE